MTRETPSEKLQRLAEETGVVLKRHSRSVAVDVWRDGDYLTTCDNVSETIKFVAQLYPVNFTLASNNGPVLARPKVRTS
jgi:hypothetical protein